MNGTPDELLAIKVELEYRRTACRAPLPVIFEKGSLVDKLIQHHEAAEATHNARRRELAEMLDKAEAQLVDADRILWAIANGVVVLRHLDCQPPEHDRAAVLDVKNGKILVTDEARSAIDSIRMEMAIAALDREEKP